MTARIRQNDECGVVTSTMNYEEALIKLSHGQKIRQKKWDNSEYLRLYQPYSDEGFEIKEKDKADGTWVDFIIRKTKSNELKPWFSSMDDKIAQDWVVVSD